MTNVLPMTREKFVAQVKRDIPVYAQIPDVQLPDLVGDAVLAGGPGAGLIVEYFAKHRITAGLFLGWLNRRRSAQEAEILTNLLTAAKAAGEMQIVARATELGIPRDVYSAVVERTHAAQNEAKLVILNAVLQNWAEEQRHRRQVELDHLRHKMSMETIGQTTDLTVRINEADVDNQLRLEGGQLEHKLRELTAEVERKYDENLRALELDKLDAATQAEVRKLRRSG